MRAAAGMTAAVMLRMNLVARSAAEYRIDEYVPCLSTRMHIEPYDTHAVPYGHKR